MTAKKPQAKKRSSKSRRPDPKTLVSLPTARELANVEKKKAFIAALAEYGTIKAACAASGVGRMTYYLWTDPTVAERYGADPARHYDEEFRDLCVQALTGDWRDKVLQTGYDKAINGWVDKKYDRNGVLMAEEHKYDSSILQMLMKRADPELRDKAPSVSVDARNQTVNLPDSQSAQVLDTLSQEQKQLLLNIIELEKQKQLEDKSKTGDEEPVEGEYIPRERS